MADRDTLASTHGYSTATTFPFSGAWAQADLQHIAGFFRKPLVGTGRPEYPIYLTLLQRILYLTLPERSLYTSLEERDIYLTLPPYQP